MKNWVKIDYTNRQIIMDRTFAKNAKIVGSEEYNRLQMARRDYAGFNVTTRTIRRNDKKERYDGLTYAYMEDYISTHEPPEKREAVLEELAEMRLISQCHSKAHRYPTIKKWFLNKYPEIVKFGMPELDSSPAVEEEAPAEATPLKRVS